MIKWRLCDKYKVCREPITIKNFVIDTIITIIAKDKEVKHASVVLKDPVKKDGETLEKRNSEFMNMMRAIAEFERH